VRGHLLARTKLAVLYVFGYGVGNGHVARATVFADVWIPHDVKIFPAPQDSR
jgi:hypothetical protein